MIDFYPIHRNQLLAGNYPLNHDAVIKIEFYHLARRACQYFTCKSHEVVSIVDILCKLWSVRRVYAVSVDELPNDF